MRWLPLVLLLGCLDNGAVVVGALDEDYFRCRVEPVLIERCAFFACHGDGDRFFVVYGPNRLRFELDEDDRGLATTELETAKNYLAALVLAQSVEGYGDPLLVSKPLGEALGGAYHEGAQLYGAGDVFETADDPDLATLRAWLSGEREDPSCVP